MMWKVQQAMRDDAIRAARTHPALFMYSYGKTFPAHLMRSRLEKPSSQESSQPALSYEHIENFTKDLEVKRDLKNNIFI